MPRSRKQAEQANPRVNSKSARHRNSSACVDSRADADFGDDDNFCVFSDDVLLYVCRSRSRSRSSCKPVSVDKVKERKLRVIARSSTRRLHYRLQSSSHAQEALLSRSLSRVLPIHQTSSTNVNSPTFCESAAKDGNRFRVGLQLLHPCGRACSGEFSIELLLFLLEIVRSGFLSSA